MESKPACKNLVLDAGPLLSLAPLRGLAEHFLTVPHVLSELKDKNAREHFERLGLSAGVKIEVREPDAASLSQVIQFAKKTGDYSVLSHADLCVIALTLALDAQEKTGKAKDFAERSSDKSSDRDSSKVVVQGASDKSAQYGSALEHALPDENVNNSPVDTEGEVSPERKPVEDVEEPPVSSSEDERAEDDVECEPLDVTLESVVDISASPQSEAQDPSVAISSGAQRVQDSPLFDDPSDEDDGEGEWITPANVDVYKSRALDLFPSTDSSDRFTAISGKKEKGRRKSQKSMGETKKEPREQISVGCMTTDFAMQNVLLQMNLSLVGIEGKRIEKVKTWVLRCHACFKICKDSSRKFCPSCGNSTLLRTSVTVKSPTADDSTPALQVHLKKNFVYRTRGTIYSIPAPKSGSSKKGSGEGLILREDQTDYMRAKKHEEGRRQREEKKLVQQSVAAARGGETTGIKLGSWMDPDWVPEMLSVGIGGKGRRAPDGRMSVGPDGMPVIGYGRKNPNERRRKR